MEAQLSSVQSESAYCGVSRIKFGCVVSSIVGGVHIAVCGVSGLYLKKEIAHLVTCRFNAAFVHIIACAWVRHKFCMFVPQIAGKL